MTKPPDLNEYASAEHALKYLARADRVPHRTEGEAVLLEFIPQMVARIREIGFQDVDCHWKRLELALFGGTKER